MRHAVHSGSPGVFACAIAATLALASATPAFPVAASSESPMSAAAFDAYSRGKTLYYGIGGTNYGAEQYLAGHQVVWAFLGQPCRFGHWYEAAQGQICFVYKGESAGPQCWKFYRDTAGLRARFMGQGAGKSLAPGESELVEIRQSAKPLECPAPAVGT